ncbi:hypothetical protein JOY44_30230 (plasmid) [Phormidium sp. CLA17]|uniref:hypothetical protein n=1 Tax=Leptolyngbya sp. Cla-17 TaxID=2803751 RepID=UPI001491F59C|nr:hypothetical protein [Leptolyngbya sp. Cla-17]MBM0745696.1 hypothetical protein [Leptolyngbya sp. Cla-17]
MGKFQISSFFAGFVDTEALQRLRGTWMQLRYLYTFKPPAKPEVVTHTPILQRRTF